MAITVKLQEKEEVKEKPFPKLMIGISGVWKDCIFLFHNPYSATIIFVGKHPQSSMGNFDNNFIPNQFTDYNEPVTLQNS